MESLSSIGPLQKISDAKTLNPYDLSFVSFAKSKLEREYLCWRSIRGDGNCYYRAVGVGLVEKLTRLKLLQSFIDEIIQGKSWLYTNEYLPFNKQLLISRLLEISNSSTVQIAYNLLEQTFLNTEFDLEFVKFVRGSVANFIQSNYNSDIIRPFADQPLDEMLTPVLTMKEEAEGLVFTGAPYVFKCTIVHVSKELVDDSRYSPNTSSRFELNLWHRGGHYDLLYKERDLIFALNTYNTISEVPTVCQNCNQAGKEICTLQICGHKFCEACLTQHIFNSLLKSFTIRCKMNCAVMDASLVEYLMFNRPLSQIICPHCNVRTVPLKRDLYATSILQCTACSKQLFVR